MTSPINVTTENYEKLIKKSEVPLLVDYWAPWCGPCKMMTPILENISKELGEKAIIAKVNVDNEPAIANKENIRSIPTLAIFKGGQLVEKLVGVQSKEVLLKKLLRE